MKKKEKWKKGDSLIILAVLVLALTGAVLIGIKRADAPQYVWIELQGESYGVYRLTQNQEISIETAYGKNKVKIENGMVTMTEADCPDKYCVEHRPIGKNAETIVCLPHKLVIELKTATEETIEIDAVTE